MGNDIRRCRRRSRRQNVVVAEGHVGAGQDGAGAATAAAVAGQADVPATPSSRSDDEDDNQGHNDDSHDDGHESSQHRHQLPEGPDLRGQFGRRGGQLLFSRLKGEETFA